MSDIILKDAQVPDEVQDAMKTMASLLMAARSKKFTGKIELTAHDDESDVRTFTVTVKEVRSKK